LRGMLRGRADAISLLVRVELLWWKTRFADLC
jgi:hypothetical protein